MFDFLKPKKIERITDVKRDGASTLAQISAFLGALLFSAFILIVEQKTNFSGEIFTVFSYHVTAFQFIAIPLIISIILFIAAAYFFGIACCEVGEKCYKKVVGESMLIFLEGMMAFFVSFLIFLFFIDIIIFLVGGIALGCVIIWMFRNFD
jgi:hypothetical protein